MNQKKNLSKQRKIRKFATQSPNGGIGRRAGLKHRWGNPSRFDPGFGYRASPLTFNKLEGLLFRVPSTRQNRKTSQITIPPYKSRKPRLLQSCYSVFTYVKTLPHTLLTTPNVKSENIVLFSCWVCNNFVTLRRLKPRLCNELLPHYFLRCFSFARVAAQRPGKPRPPKPRSKCLGSSTPTAPTPT